MKLPVEEANHLGGIRLNWVYPTKALLRSSEINHLLHNISQYGFKISGIEFDFKKIVERSRAVSKQLSGGVAHLLKKNKVTVLDGWGKLAGNGKVTVEKEGKVNDTLTAKHIIISNT